jgi:hypothetical protein
MSAAPTKIHERAADNLAFIRDTMERAGTFTAVPGYGGMAMGVTAVAAGWFAGGVADQSWIQAWLVALLIALVIGAATMALKARRARMPVFTGVGRKFLLAYAPPIAAGGVLSYALWEGGVPELLAGTWLILYGAGVVAGGSASVKPIPLMGAGFFVLGTIALLRPDLGNVLMVLGFGVLQIVFGAIIAWRHGG